jgi:single-strand DNA-binding protein
MSDLNKVQIIGRLGAEPELKSMASGAAVVTVNIATSSKWTDKSSGEKKEETEWHRVTFFNQTAEIVAK